MALDFKVEDEVYNEHVDVEYKNKIERFAIKINSKDAHTIAQLIAKKEIKEDDEELIKKLLYAENYKEIIKKLDAFNLNSLTQVILADFLGKLGSRRLKSLQSAALNYQKDMKK